MTKLVWQAPLDPAPKFVLLAYADFASDDGTGTWPGTARVAAMTGYSRRWIYEKRKDLRSSGLLVVEKESTPTTPTVYRIDLNVLRRLIEGDEPRTPPEHSSSPTGTQFPNLVHSVPPPPEPSAPKPPIEPLLEPPSEVVAVDDEVERIVTEKLGRGETIHNMPAFKDAVRKKVSPQIEAQAVIQRAKAAATDAIDACTLCNHDGIIAWEDKHSTALQSDRCSHDATDYRDLSIVTRSEGERHLSRT